MSTTEFAVRNYRFIIVVTAATLALGTLAYVAMPRQEDPALKAFGSTITVIYPAATPEELEDRVLEPIERAVHTLVEIDEIESTAGDGVAVVVARFRDDVDKDRAYDLVVQRVSEARDELPDDVLEVRVREIKPTNVVVMQAVLHGPGATHRELREWAEELEARWRVLPDAKLVELEGVQEQEIHVLVQPERLAAAGISLGQVAQALAVANGDTPAGSLQSGPDRLTIRPNLRFRDLDDIRNTVIASIDGRAVRVQDLAEVAWGDQDAIYLVRHDGEPAAMVTMTMKDGSNVFDLAKQARATLVKFEQDIPEHLTVSLALDQSEDVSERLGRFGRSLLFGALIISAFVALLVGWRPAVVIVTAMLLSVGIAFWLMHARGIALQQMSIAGLVVVLGLLVDNAIVVVEAILQKRQGGLDSRAAAIAGTDRVASAVASSTGTTVAAFVPMLFMAGSVGDFTRDIPSVVVLVLVVSLAVALFVTPLVAVYVFRGKGSKGFETPASRWLHRQATSGSYARLLSLTLVHPKSTIALLLLGAMGTLALSPLVGMNFFPRADDKPQFLVRVKLPQGSSLSNTDRNAREVESYLLEQDWTVGVTTNVGRGNPIIYYNLLRNAEAPHRAELLVKVPRERSMDIPSFARELRERFASHPELEVETKLLVQGPPVGLPVSIRLYGPDLDRLREHADTVAMRLREIPGAINVAHELRPGPARLDLRADPVKLQKLGLDSGFLAREIRAAMAGVQATTLRRDDSDYGVVVRVAPEGHETRADLERLHVPVPGGTTAPLAQLTRPTLSSTFAQIEHTDLERSVVVGADLDGRLATEIVADLLPYVEDLPFNANERFEVIGEDEERDAAFLSMLNNVVIAMGLIYGILVLQFRSFALPFIIFTCIPVALAGSVLGLLMGQWPFGFTAFIGLLALVGIVVNDAIVLVDQVNQLRRGGADLIDAIRQGCASRVQPILLTTLTTIAGLLPLTLTGGSMWGPMGWVIIGGLLASTLVTLVMVPAMYLLMERGRETSTARSGLRWPWAKPMVSTAIAMLVVGSMSLANAQPDSENQEPPRVRAWENGRDLKLTLAEVVARIDSHNLEAATLEADLAAADARWRQAKAARWPSLTLGADYVSTNDTGTTFGLAVRNVQDPMDLFAFDGSASAELLRARASIQWLLYDRSRGFVVAAAKSSRAATAEGRRAAVAQLQLAAVAQYFLAIQLAQEEEVELVAWKAVERELADARLREEAGRGLRADVLGLQARSAEIVAQLSNVQAASEVVAGRLAELLNLEDGVRVVPLTDATIQPTAVSTLDELFALAQETRAELAASELAVDAVEAGVGASSGARWPQLVAELSADTLMPEANLDQSSESYTALLGLRWRPFEGGAIGARVGEAKAQLRRAQYEVERERLAIRKQALDAWTNLQRTQRQREAAQLQFDAAQEAYRIVSLRFREGRDTLSRFLDAEASLTGARTALVRSRAQMNAAQAQVRWAGGMELVVN